MKYQLDSACIGSIVNASVRTGGGAVSIKIDIAHASSVGGLQEFDGLSAGGFQHVDLALAPGVFV
eukprot:6769533-Pyramimonas_sp.AAC.1